MTGNDVFTGLIFLPPEGSQTSLTPAWHLPNISNDKKIFHIPQLPTERTRVITMTTTPLILKTTLCLTQHHNNQLLPPSLQALIVQGEAEITSERLRASRRTAALRIIDWLIRFQALPLLIPV